MNKKPNQTMMNVSPRGLREEMQESYLDYAMSVIIARALPDVRDGLKPVHRRILYGMWDLGLTSGAKFRKSATVVGEVLGKYHPHGDVAVYDALVRLAQNFSLRYPLVAGQGNFGSMDGDSAAAMRYTEAKLSAISEELLLDIEKQTVNFVPNYDGTKKEPLVFPAKLPNLLLNGTMGIAVGMATNIPPHNLGELVDGIVHVIDHPDADIDEIMKRIPGPDFPTGGSIYDVQEIKQAYATGKGRIVMRARTDIVEKNGQFQIIVHEIPYQVNKASLIEKIATLIQEKKLDGIRDLRDESDREGVRIVIELKKDAYPKKILNRLFTHTSLQETFHVNMLALVDGIQPRVLNLKMVIEEYLKHRQTVVTRKTQFDLERAEERAHILKGLTIALANLDAVITLIRHSKDRDEAHRGLMRRFKLTDRQATAILEMRLQQLANLERQKIEVEFRDIKKKIAELKILLSSPKKILEIVKTELLEMKKKFVDKRRTIIIPHPVDIFSQEDLIPKESTIIVITRDGYIKRQAPEFFKSQSRGGKGVIGLTTKEEDTVEHLFSTHTHANILFFTTRGRIFPLKAYEVPQTSRTARGQALVNFLQLAPNEKVSEAMPIENLPRSKYLVMVTREGLIKKVKIEDFKNVRRSGLITIRLKKDDYLEWVRPSSGNDEIILVTSQGQAIHFREREIRPMGRVAAGVRGIRLKHPDVVVGMDVIPTHEGQRGGELLIVTDHGFGKRTTLKSYKVQRRGGIGIKTVKITKKTGKLIASFFLTSRFEKEDLMIISTQGQIIRLPIKSISRLGRITQGVRLMRFKEKNDQVASATFV